MADHWEVCHAVIDGWIQHDEEMPTQRDRIYQNLTPLHLDGVRKIRSMSYFEARNGKHYITILQTSKLLTVERKNT